MQRFSSTYFSSSVVSEYETITEDLYLCFSPLSKMIIGAKWSFSAHPADCNPFLIYEVSKQVTIQIQTRMWANAQPDGRPAEHRWRPLFNAAKFG